jgi:hypothetical protein
MAALTDIRPVRYQRTRRLILTAQRAHTHNANGKGFGFDVKTVGFGSHPQRDLSLQDIDTSRQETGALRIQVPLDRDQVRGFEAALAEERDGFHQG